MNHCTWWYFIFISSSPGYSILSILCRTFSLSLLSTCPSGWIDDWLKQRGWPWSQCCSLFLPLLQWVFTWSCCSCTNLTGGVDTSCPPVNVSVHTVWDWSDAALRSVPLNVWSWHASLLTWQDGKQSLLLVVEDGSVWSLNVNTQKCAFLWFFQICFQLFTAVILKLKGGALYGHI